MVIVNGEHTPLTGMKDDIWRIDTGLNILLYLIWWWCSISRHRSKMLFIIFVVFGEIFGCEFYIKFMRSSIFIVSIVLMISSKRCGK